MPYWTNYHRVIKDKTLVVEEKWGRKQWNERDCLEKLEDEAKGKVGGKGQREKERKIGRNIYIVMAIIKMG